MKRKRKIGKPNNENDRPDLHPEINTSGGNEGRQTQSISRDHNLAQNGGQSPVPMGSVFKRCFFRFCPIYIKNTRTGKLFDPVEQDLITNCTPTPPSNKRRCVLGVSMETEQVTRTSDQGSCLSSVKSHVSKATNTCKKKRGPIQKKQHMNGSALLDNITNTENLSPSETIDEASKTNNERDDDNILDDDEAIDEDLDDFRGIIEELDGSLEFDCSSQEDSDSESDIDCVHHSDGEKYFLMNRKVIKCHLLPAQT
ncbi:hypothetical protein Bca52824_023093 [Brassica carinata]|uniref:Uncharacterized protein n=1 Tax=Brassica carinata TaxID=52824 RepID=A0A8X7VHV4_BRACI|nr:hypothetical protein Bca52824_023093 [Brassica carinata]